MICKICSKKTYNNEVFCEVCGDKVLKLYLIEKLQSDEIEKIFNLLPNTVQHWYEYCKISNEDDFSYLKENPKVNLTFQNTIDSAIYESRIFIRMISFVVLSCVLFLPIVFLLISIENTVTTDIKIGGFYFFYVPLVFIYSNFNFSVIATLPIMAFIISKKNNSIIMNIVSLISFGAFILFIYVGYFDYVNNIDTIFYSNAYLILPLMICILKTSAKQIVKTSMFILISALF